jgi:hypothetical protein
MRIQVKSIEYEGYNLTLYDNTKDYQINGPWYLVAIENSLGKELFTRSPFQNVDTALAEGKKIVDKRFLGKVEAQNFVEIYTSLASDYILSFVGESLADLYDYERALTKYRSDNPIFDLLQPGQDILLSQGKFCLDDDLSLLVYLEKNWRHLPG